MPGLEQQSKKSLGPQRERMKPSGSYRLPRSAVGVKIKTLGEHLLEFLRKLFGPSPPPLPPDDPDPTIPVSPPNPRL